ncbi:unnamed protein product [Miscanthus lutarioriparius]|uniref:Uncharacterized protein n=1 Tax=Miscanthus lutarioriparius TaxID=422564 RepID=A0A811R594_9POAL|nr:unnamed protein product [Miscanthus lutarioriparius]
MAMAMATGTAASSFRRDDTPRVAAALIRVLAVAKVAFSLVNAPCLRYMNQAALGRSCTGTFCGDLLVGAMAHSWRMLVQGLASLMFFCAHADEYVRPPPSPLVLMAHDKPASHPQQVHISVVGANNMLISWVTDDRNAPSVVEYGTSPGKHTASATGNHTTYHYFFYKSGAIHHVTIGPLEPVTTYYYRCGRAGDEFSFRTPPATLCPSSDLGQTGWTASTTTCSCSPATFSYADTQQPLWDSFGRLVQAAGERAAVDGDGGQPRDGDPPRRGVGAVRRLQRAVADAARGERLALQPLLLLRRGGRRRARRDAGVLRGVTTARFIEDHILSVFREASFGHGRLRIVNETAPSGRGTATTTSTPPSATRIHRRTHQHIHMYIARTSSGDMLQIWRVTSCPIEDSVETRTTDIEMFNEVDFDKKDILYIDTLKDDALFIGHNYSCCLPPNNHPRLLPNHVYLTDDDDEYSLMDDDGQYYRRDVGMYNLEDSSVIEIVSPQPWLQLANSRMDNTKFYQDQ